MLPVKVPLFCGSIATVETNDIIFALSYTREKIKNQNSFRSAYMDRLREKYNGLDFEADGVEIKELIYALQLTLNELYSTDSSRSVRMVGLATRLDTLFRERERSFAEYFLERLEGRG